MDVVTIISAVATISVAMNGWFLKRAADEHKAMASDVKEISRTVLMLHGNDQLQDYRLDQLERMFPTWEGK